MLVREGGVVMSGGAGAAPWGAFLLPPLFLGPRSLLGNGFLPPVMSLCDFVALSRTVVSPAWLCPCPRMVGTRGLQVGAGGWSVLGQRGWILSDLGVNIASPGGMAALGSPEGPDVTR